jgi:TolB-like protein/DNA-binding winged helix-turn-helix (wHTH) protein/tetratricopeptide (TPR) repeat protein
VTGTNSCAPGTVKLEKIPMELLILLVRKDGHLASRQEIIECLWGKDVFVDTEHGINTAVRKIRLALKDDTDKPRFIQTIPGKGYRFIAELKNEVEVKNESDVGELEPEPMAAPELVSSAPEPAGNGLARRWWAGVAGIVLIAGVMVVLNVGGLRDRVFASQPRSPIHSIAVLPLTNLSDDRSQDYYADGMTDELITALARNRSLRVVSRTSVMQYKGVNRPLPEIARALGVDGILEGSVNRTGNNVHVNLQLIYGPTDSHVWAQSYDRDVNSAMWLADELSQTIATSAKVDPTPVKAQQTINPEAHDAYLRGRYLWFENSNDGDACRRYFNKAIQLQPDYAAAWSGLADSYGAEAVGMQAAPPQLMQKLEKFARHALELDESVPEAHNSMAAFYLFGKWDLKNADAESAMATGLNPNFAEAHHLRAYVLMAMQRSNEALEEQRRSSELDPFARPWGLGYVLIRLHRFDEAIEELRLKAAAQPENSGIRFNLSDAYWLKGVYGDSIREAEAGFLDDNDKKSAHELRLAFDSSGRKGAAEWMLNHAKSENVKGYVSPLALALAYAQTENRDETLKYLEQAYAEHSSKLVFLQNNPIFDFLRSEPRYRALVTKMGLPPAWEKPITTSALL